MKSFLCKGKRPVIKWGLLPDGILYNGEVPDEYSLAVCPSEGVVIIDVDKHGSKNGFDSIPEHLLEELDQTLNYPTKNKGRHYWFNYTGNESLANKASGQSIDLRTHKGYVIWYPGNDKLLPSMGLVKNSSEEMNKWLESLFGYVNK